MSQRTAVVTGGSSGIGRAIAKRLADDGARVYLTGRRVDELKAAAADIGRRAVAVPCDVSDAGDLDRLYDTVRADGRALDVVVANAGLGAGGPLAEATEEQYAHVFGVNVKGTLLTVQKAVPLLTAGASVILLSSSTNRLGPKGMGLYAASKAAVRSLGRTFAAELAPHVRVNVISPGPVATAGIENLAARLGSTTAQFHEALAAGLPLGRMGRPEEIADVAAFLAGPQSSFVTGAEFDVDGGQNQV